MRAKRCSRLGHGAGRPRCRRVRPRRAAIIALALPRRGRRRDARTGLPTIAGQRRARSRCNDPRATQFRVEITGIGATQLPIAIPAFRDEAGAPQPVSRIMRADLARSGLLPPRRRRCGRSGRAQQPGLADWRGRGRCAGGRFGDAPGRRPLRRALQALGRGQGRGAQLASHAGAAGRPAPGRAPRRRRHLREADRRARRLLHPHRLRHQVRPPASRCTSPTPTARAAGGAGQPRADHLAGLVARRPQLAYVSFESQQGGGLGAGPAASGAAAQRWPTSAAPTARRPGRPTAAPGLSRCRVTAAPQLYSMARDGGNPQAA
jgi:hypothetical protein